MALSLLFLFRSVLVASLAVLAGQSVISPECPDQGTKRIDTRVTYGMTVTCDTGVVIAGVATQGCPLFALIEPAHDVPTGQPGSNTYTKPIGTVTTKLLTYQCKSSYILIFSLGSSCELIDEADVGTLATYGAFPCDEVVAG